MIKQTKPKLSCIFLFFISGLLFTSCQKEPDSDLPSEISPTENNPPANNIKLEGNYKFISMSATTHAVNQVTMGSDVDKTITTSRYTSLNNTGTLKIEATSMSFSNLSYTVETMAKGYLYTNNVLVDSLEQPLKFSFPPVNSTAAYKRVSNDSIYFSAGSMFTTDGTNIQTLPSGAKLKVEGDKLFIITTLNQSTSQAEQGAIVSSHRQGTSTVTLQKL